MIKFFKNVFCCIFFCSFILSGQSLFESAEENLSGKGFSYELGGYIRSALFVGWSETPGKLELKSGYGEAELNIKVKKGKWGDAFASMRFKKGQEFADSISHMELREAYINLYLGDFDFRVGQQIVNWGRADAFNPTDNITPQDALVRSAEDDDRRLGNFLIRFKWNIHPFRIEAVWVPVYKFSVIPTDFIELPEGIALEPEHPGFQLNKSSFALKANLILPKIDCSLSYFEGYHLSPFLNADIYGFFSSNPFNGKLLQVFLKPYRSRILGWDFATNLGNLGLRGEVAYRDPLEEDPFGAGLPNRDLYYVLGLDRTFASGFSVIVQYIGRYIFDFKELQPIVGSDPADLLQYELELNNRLIASQTHRASHSFFCRLGLTLLHETLEFDLVGAENITTDELFLGSKLVYQISDAFRISLGGEFYFGPTGSLYDSVDSFLNAVYTELRISF